MKKNRVKGAFIRTCMGCGQQDLKQNLVRIVRNADSSVSVDREQNLDGRGAYLHPSSDCVHNAIKSRRIDKKLKVKIDDDIYESIL